MEKRHPIRTMVVAPDGRPLAVDPRSGIALDQVVTDTVPPAGGLTAPDLCVVVDLPGLQAEELVRGMRAVMGSRTPLLAVVDAGEDALGRLLEAGATDIMSPPLHPLLLGRRLAGMAAMAHREEVAQHYAGWAADQVDRMRAALERVEEELVARLARIGEYRDSVTGDHVRRMARYCWIIADELGFDKEQCRFLSLAAQMHDIGKVGIPDHILHKRGQLTPEEFETMKRHTIIGRDMLAGSESALLQLAEIISVTHHERWNGTGYPHGLSGTAIPIAGRIAAVADVFDAITSERCYKPPWSLDEARTMLLDGRATLFDPECVDAMLRRWDEVTAVIPRTMAA